LLPVEILIDEHRLIERFVVLIKKEIEKIVEHKEVEPNFIVVAVDFFRTYADKYHHGKEEGILFKGLAQKKLFR
jgi:hemerythrin-like domain-containing protein